MCRESSIRVGDRFGRLTTVKYTKFRYGSNRVWECRCDCGEKVFVPGYALISGNTCSCGCLRKENVAMAKILHQRPDSNNSTGYRGVTVNRRTGRYVARIMLNHHSHYLGSYTRLMDAVKARRRGEEEYHFPVIEAYLESHATA